MIKVNGLECVFTGDVVELTEELSLDIHEIAKDASEGDRTRYERIKDNMMEEIKESLDDKRSFKNGN